MLEKQEPKVAGPSQGAGQLTRRMGFKVAALSLVLASGLAGLGLCRLLKAPPLPPETSTPTAGTPSTTVPAQPVMFQGWTNPDLVLVVTGQQHGYLMPCGCSHPQKGGVERRYNFIEMLRAKGWKVLPVDVGDVPQNQGPAKLPNIQGLIKYVYSMKAMREMKYAAVGFGAYEDSLPLNECFSNWCLNENEPPIVGANLVEKGGPAFKDPANPKESRIHDVVFKAAGGVNVGITALIGPSVAEKKMRDKQFSYASCGETLPRVLKMMDNGKAQLRVLLYQGSITGGMKGNPPEVVALVNKFPQFDVLVHLNDDNDDLPRAMPTMLGKTMAVSLGHKARYVGVIGVWKTKDANHPFNLKYELVDMSEDFKTPDAAVKGHKIIGLLEQYKKDLKNGDYLVKYPQSAHPNEVDALRMGGKAPQYVGSEACSVCHLDTFKIWKKTPHSKAYQTLANAKNPSLNQFDPECIVCHTVGFGYKTGYINEDVEKKRGFALKNVGCESCHGPGSEHIAAELDLKAGKPSPISPTWRQLMNPYRTPDGVEAPEAKQQRILRTDAFCQQCHDKDNDVNWIHGAFERKWKKIWHYERANAPEEYKKQMGD